MYIQQKIDVAVDKECDILVAGGGIAGISAALSAARNGSKTILVEKNCLLGGLATLGLITIYLPLCDGEGNQVIFGIGEELLRLSIKYGYEDRYPKAWLENGSTEERKKTRFMVQYNPHLFAISAEQLLRDAGVKILYDTQICDVHMLDKTIDAVIIENKSGRSAIRVKSVVDSTGDADICNYAGAKTTVFYLNTAAAWYYYLTNGQLKLRQLGAADAIDEEYESKPLSDKRFSGIDAWETSEMLQHNHDQMLQDILEKRKSDGTIIPVTLPTIPQVRMSRRLVGAYELDVSEMYNRFDDSIGLTGNWRKSGPVYQIPYRCLHTKEVDNLITAGRCISVTNTMWDISRVIPTCAVTGEAAGAAASILSRLGGSFADLNVQAIQNALLNAGVKIDF